MRLGLSRPRVRCCGHRPAFRGGNDSALPATTAPGERAACARGAALFAFNPIVLNESAAGMSNLPGSSLSIVAVYLMLLGTRKPRALGWVLPVMVFAFMTRFTAGLRGVPLLVYVLAERESIRFGERAQWAGVSIRRGIIALVPFAAYYWLVEGNPFFPAVLAIQASGGTSTSRAGLVRPAWYYLTSLPALSAVWDPLGIALAATAIAGVVSLLARILRRTNPLGCVPWAGTAVAFAFGGTLGAIALCAVALLNTARRRLLDTYTLTVLAWLLPFAILHSKNPVKVDRYLLTMLPQLIVLAVLLIDDALSGSVGWLGRHPDSSRRSTSRSTLRPAAAVSSASQSPLLPLPPHRLP